MAQDYSGQLDKSNNAITAPKLSLHNLECWQINQHRCKTSSYNMCEVTKSVRYGLVFNNHGHMPQKSKASYEDGTSFKELKTVIVLRRSLLLLLISVVL